MSYPILVVLLLILSAAYSSVGLGGGTAYLAILSFWETDPQLLRPLAWELNILCSLVTFWNYFHHGHFSLRHAWPYLVGGMVGAMMGASVPLHPLAFKILLAVTLGLVSLRLMTQKDLSPQEQHERVDSPSLFLSMGISILIGGISGLVGIGGGILLGPILLGFRWMNIKQSAAITSSYILLCSFAAWITHQAAYSSISLQPSFILGATVVLGGFLGSRFGSGKASPTLLRQILSVITFLASLNILAGLVTTYGSHGH